MRRSALEIRGLFRPEGATQFSEFSTQNGHAGYLRLPHRRHIYPYPARWRRIGPDRARETDRLRPRLRQLPSGHRCAVSGLSRLPRWSVICLPEPPPKVPKEAICGYRICTLYISLSRRWRRIGPLVSHKGHVPVSVSAPHISPISTASTPSTPNNYARTPPTTSAV